MTKRLIILTIALFSYASAFSQYIPSSEIGVFLGGSYYIGDLNPYKHFYNIKPAGGIVFRRNLNQRYSVRGNLLYGNVGASDADALSVNQRNRNLSFKSSIIELGGVVELNYFKYDIGSKRTPATPYMFVGLTYFKMNPKGKLDDTWYELQPLGTEGPDKSYKLNQIAIPFGVGLKTNLGSSIGLQIEWGFRKTYTDYLDDVSTTYADPTTLSPIAAQLANQSNAQEGLGDNNTGLQRGNSQTKDWYVFTGIMITYRLGEKGRICARFKG